MARERSFWGWGWADKFPDDESRRALAARRIDARDRAARAADAAADRGISFLRPPGPGAVARPVLQRSGERAHLSHLGQGIPRPRPRLRGRLRGRARFRRAPARRGRGRAVLDWCARHGVAAIPFGGGTSVVGGVEQPPRGGRSRRRSSHRSRRARSRARGRRTSRAPRASRPARSGPRSRSSSPRTASRCATSRSRSSSPRSAAGSRRAPAATTRRSTRTSTISSSRCAWSRRAASVRDAPPARRPAPGPSPSACVLGSEGALGIITEAWMRVQPRPRWRASASVRFAASTRRGRRGARARAVGPLPVELPPARRRRGDAPPRRDRRHERAARSRSSPPITRSSRGWSARCRALPRSTAASARTGPSSATTAPTGTSGAARRAGGRRSSTRRTCRRALVSLGRHLPTRSRPRARGIASPRFTRRSTTAVAGGAAARRAAAASSTCRFTHVYPDGPAPYYTFARAGRARARELEQWAAIKAAATRGARRERRHDHASPRGRPRLHRPWYDRERPPLFAAALARREGARSIPRGILNPAVPID